MLVLAVAVAGWPDQVAASPEGDLRDARQRIEDVERELSRVAEQTNGREAELAEVESQVRTLEAALNDTLTTLEAQRAAVGAAEDEAAAAVNRREAIRLGVEKRARQAYMHLLPPGVAVLAAGDDVPAAIQAAGTLAILARRDGATMEQLAAAETAADVAAQQLSLETERLLSASKEQQRMLDRARTILSGQRESVAAARARQEMLRAEQEDLQQSASELRAIIERRRDTSQRAAPTSVGSGGYRWPVCGPVTSEFGPRWGRSHEGIDIDGSTGDVLVAAQDGTVIFAGWSGGYGQLTLIEHPDGVVSAYAHQSRQDVTAGQSVSQGQRIGLMGATGNVTGDHLHFETRVGGRAVNPRRYLSASC